MLCDIVPCGKKAEKRRMCPMHYERGRRNGSPHKVHPRGYKPRGHENPNYVTLHWRLGKALGPAKNHPCVDCGEEARDWSYNRSGVEEYMAWCLSEKTYYPASNDMSQYVPRCKPCHTIFDGSQHEGLNEAAS